MSEGKLSPERLAELKNFITNFGHISFGDVEKLLQHIAALEAENASLKSYHDLAWQSRDSIQNLLNEQIINQRKVEQELAEAREKHQQDYEETQELYARIAELEDTLKDLHQRVPNAPEYTDPATTLLKVGSYIGRLQGRIMGLEKYEPKHCVTCGHLEELHTKSTPERFCLLNLTSNCTCKKYEATTTQEG